jgi:hypothetical protein
MHIMMTPAACGKSHLKEITLRTKEKQLLQGRRYANQHLYYCMFGVQLSYLGTAIGLF